MSGQSEEHERAWKKFQAHRMVCRTCATWVERWEAGISWRLLFCDVGLPLFEECHRTVNPDGIKLSYENKTIDIL